MGAARRRSPATSHDGFRKYSGGIDATAKLRRRMGENILELLKTAFLPGEIEYLSGQESFVLALGRCNGEPGDFNALVHLGNELLLSGDYTPRSQRVLLEAVFQPAELTLLFDFPAFTEKLARFKRDKLSFEDVCAEGHAILARHRAQILRSTDGK
jgi:hypothetical protein